ncbi:adenylate cyclase [Enhydrobacter aerosaccus]|uniref:Adenylate cyclase n=1 Tax=Enhydrobacter aerosaccus TaxID=225324 RepID=A0A1T4JN29_9HYPH|nr:adenylate/guanylate cyclase domain-containing protein [Enhydrobacter aerosaccus]SJZ31531.1 adenylate cyclase [Enhydrobacter aerosaccus]
MERDTDAGPSTLIEWLAGDECYALDDAGLADELGRRLRAAGLPLDHVGLYLRTLHPEIIGHTIVWAPNEPARIYARRYDIVRSSAYLDNPVRRVLETEEPLVLRVGTQKDESWTQIDIFKGRHLVEFVILPLCSSDALPSAVSFATTSSNGFTAAQRAALYRIVPALRNACELRTLRKVERTLLDTYLGTLAGRRILEGRVRRGEVETFEAALMLCDLRGFTELSNRLPSERVLELLDAYFDCVIPAVNEVGGEVIKFMGDAVLAFFYREDASAACAAALRGALAALDSLRGLSVPDAELRAGIALHYGMVSYGNIGYGHRLDFTLIGPDVNLVSRLQGICSTTAQPLLMSQGFARLISAGRVVALGPHELKGFAKPVNLYTITGLAPGCSH